MSDPKIPESQPIPEPEESFDQAFSQYEKSRSRKREDAPKQLQGTVVAVSAESVFVDIGYKTEGILPRALFDSAGTPVNPGDTFPVSITGRDPEGYYLLSRSRVARPVDWPSLEQAFAEKATIMGTVTEVRKGGLTVDVGVRAFMPASRSGTRDAAELEKLVGTEIKCRIIKLDVADEDVVVDRRAVAEEEERATEQRRYSELKEGDTVRGEVRSLTDYGAFVDLGGIDGLLHVGDIAWRRVDKPGDVLSVGQQIEARVLKVDTERRRISLGMKQLQEHPWDSVPARYKAGDRVRGTVTRVADFGAFVELEPGIEGLIHVSEMSWGRKVRAVDVVKPGDTVEAVILGVKPEERRLSLGLKQALGDPWADAARRFAAGTVVEGTVTSLTKFGAFIQLVEGVEGMVHVSEISAEKRINHPQDVLKLGQTVQAQVLAFDPQRRQLKLSMKQLVPTGVDEYIAEHKVGDVVSGRVVEVTGDRAGVELGEGIRAACRIAAEAAPEESKPAASADLSSLSAMLNAKWKTGSVATGSRKSAMNAGQVRSFRIVKLDPEAKKIELESAQ